jgi:DNA-binding transcriptional ArsR family regulator
MISRQQVEQIYSRQTQFYKLLTHPARIAILNVLREEEACVCHLEAVLGYRQAYISQQLAVLREAGLIQDRREAWNVFYHVSDPRIYDVIDLVNKILHPEGTPGLPNRAEHCPCPKCNPGTIDMHPSVAA